MGTEKDSVKIYDDRFQCPKCKKFGNDYDGYCVYCGSRVVSYDGPDSEENYNEPEKYGHSAPGKKYGREPEPMVRNDYTSKELIISIVAVLAAFGLYKLSCVLVFNSVTDSVFQVLGEEVVFVLLALGAAFLTKRLYTLKWRTDNMGKGFLYSLPLVIMAVVSLVPWIEELSSGEQTITAPVYKIILYTFSMIILGIAEELLFRGILLNGFCDFFGGTVSAMRKAVIFSSLVFGALHLFNILTGATVMGAAVQAIDAAMTGMLWGAAYIRTRKNLWPFIIIHAFSDWCGFAAGGILMGVTKSSTISSYSPATLIFAVVYVALAIFEMRTSKLEELEED